jgi:hypothetical protein
VRPEILGQWFTTALRLRCMACFEFHPPRPVQNEMAHDLKNKDRRMVDSLRLESVTRITRRLHFYRRNNSRFPGYDPAPAVELHVLLDIDEAPVVEAK